MNDLRRTLWTLDSRILHFYSLFSFLWFLLPASQGGGFLFGKRPETREGTGQPLTGTGQPLTGMTKTSYRNRSTSYRNGENLLQERVNLLQERVNMLQDWVNVRQEWWKRHSGQVLTLCSETTCHFYPDCLNEALKLKYNNQTCLVQMSGQILYIQLQIFY